MNPNKKIIAIAALVATPIVLVAVVFLMNNEPRDPRPLCSAIYNISGNLIEEVGDSFIIPDAIRTSPQDEMFASSLVTGDLNGDGLKDGARFFIHGYNTTTPDFPVLFDREGYVIATIACKDGSKSGSHAYRLTGSDSKIGFRNLIAIENGQIILGYVDLADPEVTPETPSSKMFFRYDATTTEVVRESGAFPESVAEGHDSNSVTEESNEKLMLE